MKKYLLYVSHLYAFSIVRPLQAQIRRQGGEVAWFLARKQYQNCLEPGERHLESVADVMAFQPDAVFVASNVVPDFFPGIKVQLFHGFNARKREATRGHFRIRGFFHLYCTQGPDTTVPFQELERQYGCFKVMETGWCKLDPLFQSTSPSFLAGQNPADSRPVVLFASTFTPALSAAHRIYDTVAAMVQDRSFRWIITFHPKMAPDVVAQYRVLCQNHNALFYEGDDVIPLLQQAHVMLSDTSSILSEFMVQQRPVVTFNNRIPGDHLINVTRPEEIPQAITQALDRPAPLMAAIERYVAAIHPYADGCSSQRVLAAVDAFMAGKAPFKRPPLNLFRRLKMRMKHRYFRW